MASYTDVQELFHSIINEAGPKTIFGEPISAEGKTIVPVVKIRYGFGGGSGQKREGQEHGGGGGGGLMGQPVGVIEITSERTRFIPIQSPNWMLAAAAGIGVCLGFLIAPRTVDLRVDKRRRD